MPVKQLDNKSLIDEDLILTDCIATNVINNMGQAFIRYTDISRELGLRTDMLNNLAELYDNTLDWDSDERAWAESNVTNLIQKVLQNPSYHVPVRSSIAPYFTLNERSGEQFIRTETVKYFENHGGYENAHKAKFMWLKLPILRQSSHNSADATVSLQLHRVYHRERSR